MEKRCIGPCQRVLPLSEFYRHSQMADGHFGKCKECVKAYTRDHYGEVRPARQAYELERQKRPKRQRQMLVNTRRQRKKHPERERAHAAVARAIKKGLLVRGPCEVCGTTRRVQGHHDDYSKPLEVRWLCVMDHRRAEKKTPF